jgi:hypothetical protein
VRAFEQALQAAGVPSQITVYEGQPHAFIHSADPAAAGGPEQEAWEELLGFLRQSLAGAATQPSRIAGADDPAALFSPARAMHMFVCDLTVRG